MHYDRTVVAYHGCDAKVAERLLAGDPFVRSENDYDWLGEGIYFWEFGLDRAWRWAQNNRKDPAVVGALLRLGKCFDLLDTRNTETLAALAQTYVGALQQQEATVPKNGGRDLKLRRLDCALINFTLSELAGAGVAYQTVRCAFWEGAPVFDGGDGNRSMILHESHIQIAVRDPECIIGTFRPANASAAARNGSTP